MLLKPCVPKILDLQVHIKPPNHPLGQRIFLRSLAGSESTNSTLLLFEAHSETSLGYHRPPKGAFFVGHTGDDMLGKTRETSIMVANHIDKLVVSKQSYLVFCLDNGWKSKSVGKFL